VTAEEVKDIYRQLCLSEPSIPIFSRDWWLDAVAGEENWNVSVVERGGEIVATLPYVFRRYCGFSVLTQPPLTQTLGPWIRSRSTKYSKKLSKEKDYMDELIAQLPSFDHFSQNWHHSQTNWLPFYWQGFNQTTRYTYRLRALQDDGVVWNGFSENIRGDIRKARDRFKLTVRTDLGIEEFLKLNVQVFERQGKRLPYSEELVQRLELACQSKGVRRIFIAEDELGRHHAGVYIIWDENSAYYLMGGGDPALRNSGATSLCLWEAIRFSATVTKSFDFEGSMIESVERFFRAFGGEQTPYLSVSKTPSRLLKIRHAFRILAES
jgi:hypothetical protein